MSKRRVIMVGPSPASRGGMATVIEAWLAHQQRHKVTFLATQVDGSRAAKVGVAVSSLASYLSLVMTGRLGLLHVHVASGWSFWRKCLFIVPALAMRRPVVFHLHAGRFTPFIDGLSPTKRRLALGIIRRSTRGLALTPDSLAWMREICGIQRTEIMPNPVVVDTAGDTPAPGSDGPILYVGRIEAAKGVFDLLDAFEKLRAHQTQRRLVIAGDGSEMAAIASSVKERGLERAVELVGWIDASRRKELMHCCSMLVLPSHTEQMPMILLEAMAAGVPVVATRVGAVESMLDGGKLGLLVEPHDVQGLADALADTLLQSQEALNRARLAHGRVLERHAIDNVMRRVEHLWSDLLRD